MSTQDYTYCLIESNSPVGKVYNPDGTKTVKPVFNGIATNFVASLDEFAEMLRGLEPNECLTTGLCRQESVRLTTKDKEEPGKTLRGLPVVARSKENWHWADEPGFIVFDHDPDHWTFDPLTSIEAVVAAIGDSLKVDMTAVDWVAKPSSSSYVNGGGLRGVHVYVGVTSLADIDAEALQGMAFQNDLGCGYLSRVGAILRGGAFDSAMHKANCQPVFSGPPTGADSTAADHVVVNHGAPLDLASVQAGYRPERAEEAWQTIRASLGGASKQALEAYVKESGRPREVIMAAVDGGELDDSWPLVFDDNSQVTLKDILAAPEEYDGRTDVRDPLEPEYGPSKAKIFIDGATVVIHSMAHGGRTFRCLLGGEGLADLLQRDDVKKQWQAYAGAAQCSVTETVNALKGAGVDGTKGELKEQVRRLRQQALARRVEAGDWRARYAYLASSNKFVDLDMLYRKQLIVTVPASAFDVMHGPNGKWGGERPSTYMVGGGHIPSYSRVVSRPADRLGGPVPEDAGELNIWQPGPRVERFDAEPLQWMQLVKHVVPEEEERENLLDWMAYALQYPGRKCNWQVILHGQQGIGKDSMLWPLRCAMGHHNAIDVTTPELLGDFNHYLAGGAKLLVVQELDAAHKTQLQNKMKPLAAAPPAAHSVNQKNEKPFFVDNMQAVVVLTNAIVPLSLDKGDRRWYMISCPNGPLDGAFFNRLWAWYNSGGIRQVAGWLAGRDLGAFSPDVIPANTAYKDNVIELSQTGYLMAVRDYIEEVQPQVLDPKNLSRIHFDNKITPKQVMTALTELRWRPVRATKKINGVVRTVRGWVSPACELAGNNLFDAIFKVKSL